MNASFQIAIKSILLDVDAPKHQTNTSLDAYWIVAVSPVGDEGAAIDPNLYAPASQLPANGRCAPTLSLDSGAKTPVVMLTRLEAAPMATEPESN